jgi:hypothetical protein
MADRRLNLPDTNTMAQALPRATSAARPVGERAMPVVLGTVVEPDVQQ